jgi:mycothiol synthase
VTRDVDQVAIRAAEDSDLPAMRRLAASAFVADPIDREALVGLLAGRPGQQPELCLVAVAPRDVGRAEAALLGFVIGWVRAGIGYIDAVAVDAGQRRQGIGRELVGAVEYRLARAGARTLRIGGSDWYYAWPGVDLAYTAAFRLAERAGYRRCGTIQNMTVGLRDRVPGSSRAVVQGPAATRMRRAEPADAGPLDAFVARHFSRTWRREASLALDRPVPTVFVGVRGEHVVGFGCHGVYRRDWFGPLGTDPALRSGGIGAALLGRCLDDLAAAGLEQAEICWVGPTEFYARTVGARCDREFALFEKDLDAHLATPGS